MVKIRKRTVIVQADFDGGAAGTAPIMRTNKLRGTMLDQVQLHSNAEIQYNGSIWEQHFDDAAEAFLELNGSLIIKDYGLYIGGWIELGFILGIDERVKVLLIGKEED